MFQMLYHVRDMEETILNYLDKLVEGGLMVITIASKRTYLHAPKIIQKFDKSRANKSEISFKDIRLSVVLHLKWPSL